MPRTGDAYRTLGLRYCSAVFLVRSVASSAWALRVDKPETRLARMYGAGCFDEYTNQPSRSLNEQAWVAAGSNSLATLASLLDSEGYDVNWRNEKNNQLTALAIACERGHATCVDMLISKGADLNLPSMGGLTPLMLAAAHMPHSSFMDAGNRTTLWTDAHGRAAAAPTGAFSSGRVIPAEVDSAPGDGKLACTRLLLAAGADHNLKCDSRKTALTQAVEATRLLEKHDHTVDRAIQLLVGASPPGLELLELLQQTAFEHLTLVRVRVGVGVGVMVGVRVRARARVSNATNPDPDPDQVLLREGVHDVQALADLLADPRLNAHWFRTELSP